MQNLIGLILPPIIDLVNSRIANDRIKFLVSVVICTLIAAAVNYQQLNVNSVGAFLQSASIVFTESQLVYALYWKKSSVREAVLKRI
ncbi:MAG: hypothetical protein WC549_00545 [Actinomycetota bacterium]